VDYHSGLKRNSKSKQACLMIEEQCLLEQLSPEDSKHRDFIELGRKIGAFALNELMEYWGGEKKHVPKADVFWNNLLRDVRDHEIKTKFKGSNYLELAEEYDLSPRHIHRIIHGRNASHRKKNDSLPRRLGEHSGK